MKFVHRGELSRYHTLPKEFVGPQKADELYSIYEKLSQANTSYGYLFAAASAAAESGMMATHLSTDERHHRLQCADQTWQDARTVFLDKHKTKDWSEAQRLVIPDRVEMNRIYLPLYHDFVDGNVREATIDKTHGRLVRLGVDNLQLHDQAEQQEDIAGLIGRRGLGYELCTLMTVTRLTCPSFFAVPATARADHGGTNPEETHDVRLIRQSWGSIQECIPYEVKPADGAKRQRYRSAYVRGRIELVMPSATHALELAHYMSDEVRGVISPEHLLELNEITSRVLRQAVDYTNRMTLADTAIDAVA